MKRAFLLLFSGAVLVLVFAGTQFRDFWRTADQRGQALMKARRFADAAKAFATPARIGLAQYRNGDFEAAAKTFARVPGAEGAYNQGNAWLMHGKYDAAIASYDRALGFRAGWKDAEDNKAVAVARKARIEASGKDRDQEAAEAYKPDDIVFDQKGGQDDGKPMELAQTEVTDAEMRATWLRRVKTTPGDFLRAKFAFQAQRDAAPGANPKEATR